MEDNIPASEKSKWFRELLDVQAEIAKENDEFLVNQEYKVLCDEKGRREGFMAGHTDNNICFEFEGDEKLLGEFVNIITYEKNGEILAKIKE